MQTLSWLFLVWGLDKTIIKLLSKTAGFSNDKYKLDLFLQTNDFCYGENSYNNKC